MAASSPAAGAPQDPHSCMINGGWVSMGGQRGVFGRGGGVRLRSRVVPSLNDLAPARTDLSGEDVDWLHLLLADWQLIADLSFADLVLWLPLRAAAGFVAAGHVRPSTGPTAHHDDMVGTVVPRGRRTQLDTAYDEQRICRERDPDWPGDVPVREETIPVVREGRVLAVVSRHTNLAAGGWRTLRVTWDQVNFCREWVLERIIDTVRWAA